MYESTLLAKAEGYDMSLPSMRAALDEYIDTGKGDMMEILEGKKYPPVSVGQSVDPSAPLFQVVDPSRMWAEIDVSESDLASVEPGQPVRITLDALPDRGFEGTLDYLAPSIDPRTRTARGRVVLDNTDGALRANMYGLAHITTDTTSAVVTVPSAAGPR